MEYLLTTASEFWKQSSLYPIILDLSGIKS
jgi:hypothetical protein